MKVSAILLSGGIGSRMQAEKPKQYLPLKTKPVARHSFELLCEMKELQEIIVVCDPAYRHFFPEAHSFALPGQRRQDSVYNGLQLAQDCQYILIHDAARPLISKDIVLKVLEAASIHGAAACGMPLKFTVKETQKENFVVCTPNRDLLWEIQTPQVIKRELLQKGFLAAQNQNLTVTDDVSLVELLHHPVKLVEGSHSNIKITTPEDLILAEKLLV